MRAAMNLVGTEFDLRGGSVTDFVQGPANDDFSAVVIDLRKNHKLPRKTLGKIAGVGTETVKAWERGRQKPQNEHLFRMARTIPSVKRWTLRQLGVEEQIDFMSPRVMSAMMAAMQQVAQQPGPDGDAVRALLQGRR